MAYSEMSYAEVAQDPDTDLQNPRRQRKLRFFSGYNAGGRLGSTGIFFATAALSGFLCYLVFSFFFPTHLPPPHLPSSWDEQAPADVDAAAVTPLPSTSSSAPSAVSTVGAPPSYAFSPPIAPPVDHHEMSIEELSSMVATTKGYFVRDYSLALGWNNVRVPFVLRPFSKLKSLPQMRYIIEAAHEQATLLNRTLVLPSFVYARACEYEL